MSNTTRQHSKAGVWPECRPGRFASRIIDLHQGPDPLEQLPKTCFSAAGHDFRGLGLLGLADDLGVKLDGVYFDAHPDGREDDGSGMSFRRLIEHGGIGALNLFGFDHTDARELAFEFGGNPVARVMVGGAWVK